MTGEIQQTVAGKMKVFISYSRRDVDFAGELELALTDKGYDPLVDRHDIDPGEKWKDRLGQLLFACDTVVFVLTAHSAGSPICAWEVEEAARLGKRMLVVTPGAVPPGLQPPPQLSDLNWIHCWRNPDKPGSSLMRGFVELDTALKTDLKWLRQQTWLSEQAAMWQARVAREYYVTTDRQQSSMLLRGNVLAEALDWIRLAPINSVVPPLVAEFLEVSEQAEAARRAEALAQLAEREAALKAAETAANEKEEAIVAREATLKAFVGQAEKLSRATKKAAIFGILALAAGVSMSALALAGGYFTAQNYAASSAAKSALFAGEANGLLGEGQHAKAMLMALTGDPAAQAGAVEGWFNRDGYGAAQNALGRAINSNHLLATFRGHIDRVSSVRFAPDGNRFLTSSTDGTAMLWQIGRAEPLQRFQHESSVLTAAFMPDGRRLLTVSKSGAANLWRPDESRPLATFSGKESSFRSIALSPDGEHFLTGADDGKVLLWRIGDDHPKALSSGSESPIESVAYFPDGITFLTASNDGTARRWSLDGHLVAEYRSPSRRPLHLIAASEDGQTVVTVSSDGTANQWTAAGDAVADFLAFDRPMMFMRLLRDNPLEADEKSFAATGISSVIFARSGEMLTGSSTGTLSVWPAHGGAPLAQNAGHDGAILSIAVSADGANVLTGSADGAVKLWSTRAKDQNVQVASAINPKNSVAAKAQVKLACDTLRSIGVLDFSEADWQRFPILDRKAQHPCAKVWGFDPRKGETAAVVVAGAK